MDDINIGQFSVTKLSYNELSDIVHNLTEENKNLRKKLINMDLIYKEQAENVKLDLKKRINILESEFIEKYSTLNIQYSEKIKELEKKLNNYEIGIIQNRSLEIDILGIKNIVNSLIVKKHEID